MLAQHRVVLLDRELLGHGAGVLAGDIEKAGAAFAVEADLRGGRLRHGTLQKGQVERGGRWLTGPSPVKDLGGKSRFSALFTPKTVLAGPFSGLAGGWTVPPGGFLAAVH